MDNIAIGFLDWMDATAIDKCHLVAYSMGGRLGLHMVINYPDRFDKVILESSSPGLKTEEERVARLEHDYGIIKKLQALPVEQFMQEWYDQPLFDSLREHPDKLERLLHDQSQASTPGWVKSLQMMGTGKQFSLWPRIDEVRHEPLLIVGEKDAKFQAIAKEMAEAISGAKMVVVPGAGHNVHLEKPSVFVEQVRQYLT